jgi:hypothetical protein
MASALKAQEILNREFLEIRAKLLQLAAHFDRIERGEGEIDLGRLTPIRRALEVLSSLEVGPHRAEKVQMIFSREYDPEWRANLGVTADTAPGR